jgi:hypothetical protein
MPVAHRIASSLATLAAAIIASAGHADTIFVNVALATGANNGTSWADAFQGITGLQSALAASGSGDQIWVAQGTYKPTAGTTRTTSFNLKNGVEIYGGFIGAEAALAERDWIANETILSGDLLGDDGPAFAGYADNSFHIVNGSSQNSTAILDGFTVRGGNANAATPNDRGGGLLMQAASNGTIRNCKVIANRCNFGGGAGYINGSSPAFADTTFQGNLGGSFGGAFDMASNCNPSFNRCQIISNSAQRAGGIEVFGNSAPTIRNCLFRSNTATGAGSGGAMFIASSSNPVIRDCTFVGNSTSVAATGGGILTNGSNTNIANSIVWANSGPGGSMVVAHQIAHAGAGATTVQFSDVMGGFAGTGNINANPTFVDQPAGDLHLGAGSPCIDAASNPLVPAGVTIDLDGNPRFIDDPATADTGIGTPPIVDMGAYEFQPRPKTACPADLNGSGDVNGLDLATLLGVWTGAASYSPCPPFTPADLNEDCKVNGLDLALLLGAWGPCR